jgi:hypothetical protein
MVVNAEVFRRDFNIDYPDVEAAKRRFYRLTYQLTRMTKAKGAVKHDDRADGLSSGVAHFVERLQKTLDEARAAGRGRALEIEAEKMIELRRKSGLPLFGLEKKPGRFGRGVGQRVKQQGKTKR